MRLLEIVRRAVPDARLMRSRSCADVDVRTHELRVHERQNLVQHGAALRFGQEGHSRFSALRSHRWRRQLRRVAICTSTPLQSRGVASGPKVSIIRSFARRSESPMSTPPRVAVELTHQRGAEGVIRGPEVGDNRSRAGRNEGTNEARDAILSLCGAGARIARR